MSILQGPFMELGEGVSWIHPWEQDSWIAGHVYP